MTESVRPLRADARRNRARVLEVAQEVFEAEGLAVPVDEVARRAGVGVGTVYRHFPTKEALFAAIMAHRVEQLTAEAQALAEAQDPGQAFFDFFAVMIRRVVLNKALGEALIAAGHDMVAITSTAGKQLRAAQEVLLTRAQQAGAVRADLDGDDLKAILIGVITTERQIGGEPGRLAAIMIEGLRVR